LLANILQVAGVVSVAVGAFLIWVPAGFIVAGAGLILFGLAAERSK
jgi:hypothetical protein